MKKLFISIVMITVLLTSVVAKNDQDTIIIYSSLEQFRGDALQEQLKEKFPELNAYVMYVPTAKSAAKISVEGTGSDADILLGVETAYLEKVQDSLADTSSYTKLDYLDELDNINNKYVVWERQAGSIIVNNAVIKKHNLPVPKTYDDLLNPIYKNLIAMPDPKSSGTGYFFYKNLVNVKGEAGALEYIDKLSKNVKTFTESGSGPVKLLKQGEIAIGLGLTFQAVDEFNKGNDFTIIEPEYGSPYSLTGAGIIKGREKDEDIMRVYDFIINDFLVYDKENFSPEKVLKEQTNKMENYPKDIKYANMKGIESISAKEHLLSVWKF
ncbi:MAG: extracellular solute-binding protein [Erysipelotrichaceae bacterium]